MTDAFEDLNHNGELPLYYGEDRLVLLVRDPYSFYAYWEVSLPTQDRLRESWGEEFWQDSAPFLRVYKHHISCDQEVESFFDIPVNRESNNWYISVNTPGRTYHAELGWLEPGNSFFPVLRSNNIQTPRDRISEIIDENWQLPDWKARKLFRRISVYHLSSPEMLWRKKQQV